MITKYNLRKCKYLKLEMIDLQDQVNELVSWRQESLYPLLLYA